MCKQPQSRRRLSSKKGNSLIEFTFLVPWYVFLFIGSFDLGVYSYALTAEQEGVRIAALNASQNSSLAANSGTACTYVLGSLQGLPNMSGVNACGGSNPVTVTATYGATSGPDGGPETTVTAVYTTPQLIPIPGLLPGQLTITKTVEMRVRG
jgi:Flp pilus assembly protein TadG